MLKSFKNFDWLIFILLICLMLSGVIAIYSASTTKISNEFQTKNFYIKQIIWILISMGFLMLLLRTPGALLDFLIIPAYIFSLLLLAAVLFMPAINGSHRWFMLGGISFQPSELAKITTILLVAKVISKPHLSEAGILFRGLGVTLLPVMFILMEPDLGTSLTFFVFLFAILAASNLPLFYLILIISPLLSVITSFSIPIFIIYLLILIFTLYRMRLSTVLIGFATAINSFIFFLTPFIWNSLRPYQQGRILTFLDPKRDPFGAGYQIIQSQIAIGSGGINGKGFLLGTQKNLNFLPEHHTDFIFSVIGEEFGFLGCLFILLLYFLFLRSIAKSIGKLKRTEKGYAAIGILTYLTFQVFINVGMNMGIVPTTGIPLPFISYGGSNLLINMLGVGLILKYLNERSVFE